MSNQLLTNKQKIVGGIVGLSLALIVFTTINVAYGQMHNEYSLKCGIPKDIPVELWQQTIDKQYEYELDNMPPAIKEQRLCTTAVQYGLQ